MFSVLMERKPPAGAFLRLFLKPAVTLINQRPARFAIVTLPNKQHVDWREIQALLGRTASNIVLGEGIVLPQGSGLSPVDTSPLSRRMLLTALGSLLRQADIPLRQMDTALIDPGGKGISYAKVLVKYSGRLRVVTAATDLYEDFSSRMLEEYGAVVTVDAGPGGILGSRLVAAPFGLPQGFAKKITAPVLSALPSGAQNGYDSFESDLPSPFRELKPEGVPPFVFQAALYGACHIEFLGEAPVLTCRRWGEKIPLEQAAWEIFKT